VVDDIGRQLNRTELPVIQEWCFAPETLVATPDGRRRIDEIREGDDVLAFDFDRGQWVKRIVQACHRSQYLGAMIEITTEQGTVEATAYHPFWVLEGHDLVNRPRPRELAEYEDEGLSLPGRWVNSHDLLAGDLLVSADGRQLRVQRISQRYEESFAVCNLTIDTNHSFAVGIDGILVHNTGGCGRFGIDAPKGGPHGQTKLPWGDGLESHHMPAKSINGLHPDVGPAIQMDRADHLLTSSHGSRSGSAAYRSHIEDLLNQGKVREAMAIEIRDVRRAAFEGSGDMRKYNNAMREMLEYARRIGYVP
jgi:hypothetical protein